MNANTHFIPEHPVPMRLETIANTKSERIDIGRVSVVRVHTIAKIESFEFVGGDVELVCVDENNRILVKKILTPAFPRSRAEEFLVGDFVEIFGKVRVLEDGTSFLNAFHVDVTSVRHFTQFKTICRIAHNFYQENLPELPKGVHSSCADRLGLREKAGSLDRFPIDMLEGSSSQINNKGVWPAEIAELAGGIPGANGTASSDSSSDDEDEENMEFEEEDDDGVTDEEEDGEHDEEDEEDEEEEEVGGDSDGEETSGEESMEDSFGAGPSTAM